ncbi:hypothetical protein N0V90_009515 [Kalmusia sp. IMI 367209]|nr:hypothetical protein N0V90_009515 [Kalmusia sp. IMI 367209]
MPAESNKADKQSSQRDHQVYLSSSIPVLKQYITIEEESQILEQFRTSWRPNNQVLWSGVDRGQAQKWANSRSKQTLTTAMGPLMDKMSSKCSKKEKSKSDWIKYIKGASALFAWSIARGDSVVVLSPPPPQRFNPNGFTNFQMIEAPVLHWAAMLSHASLKVYVVHPIVKGAEDFLYQIWPVDETSTWNTRFKTVQFRSKKWRVPGWDDWKVLFRNAIDSVVGLGFWDGVLNWKENPAHIKDEERKIKEKKEQKMEPQKKKKKKKKKKQRKTLRRKTNKAKKKGKNKA